MENNGSFSYYLQYGAGTNDVIRCNHYQVDHKNVSVTCKLKSKKYTIIQNSLDLLYKLKRKIVYLKLN